MRAGEPDRSGYVNGDGVDIHYEVFGSGSPALLLLPTWNLRPRCWRMQVPYPARHLRLVTYDGQGNGRSDRPPDPRACDMSDEDGISPLALEEAPVAAVDGTLLALKGTGHIPLTREPARVNLLGEEFVDRMAGRAEVAA